MTVERTVKYYLQNLIHREVLGSRNNDVMLYTLPTTIRIKALVL